MLANTLFAVTIFRLVTANNIAYTNERIQELESEKNELFKQINHAIDDSVKSLQKLNETDALIGINYMTDLREYLKKVNETSIDENRVNVTNTLDMENRRKFHKLIKKKKTNDPFDFESVVGPKRLSEDKWKEIMNDREKMQKQLNEWLIKREKEKERIKQYRLYKKGMIMSGKYEKCPRFGYQGKKKKGSKDKIKRCKVKITGSNEEYKKCLELSKDKAKTTAKDDDDIKYVNVKSLRKNKYPCCRKCCKKSYMGCL